MSHLCVHENDDRKGRFRFDWSNQLAPLARLDEAQDNPAVTSRSGVLAAKLQAKLSRLESIAFARRSFLHS